MMFSQYANLKRQLLNLRDEMEDARRHREWNRVEHLRGVLNYVQAQQTRYKYAYVCRGNH